MYFTTYLLTTITLCICIGFFIPVPVTCQSGGWPTTTTASSGWGPSTGPSCTGVMPTLASGQTWVPNPGCPSGGAFNDANNQRCHCWSHCGYICGSPTAGGWDTTTTTQGWSTPKPTTAGWGTPTTQGWNTPKPTTAGWGTPSTQKPTTAGWGTQSTQGWTTQKPTTAGWGTPTTQGWGSSASPCANVRPILSSGQTWVPNADCTNGNTYNNGSLHCHCWSHCGYICEPKTTTTTPGWSSG